VLSMLTAVQRSKSNAVQRGVPRQFSVGSVTAASCLSVCILILSHSHSQNIPQLSINGLLLPFPVVHCRNQTLDTI
ncbi:unnamed protein product, partial [Citrullus colocynthis]